VQTPSSVLAHDDAHYQPYLLRANREEILRRNVMVPRMDQWLPWVNASHSPYSHSPYSGLCRSMHRAGEPFNPRGNMLGIWSNDVGLSSSEKGKSGRMGENYGDPVLW